MKDFYEAFFTAVEHSRAHRAFCERVFGRDLGQHGFSDLKQLELLIDVVELGPGRRMLDLGCGNGMIAEYLTDRTGAHVTGLDYYPVRSSRRGSARPPSRIGWRSPSETSTGWSFRKTPSMSCFRSTRCTSARTTRQRSAS